MSSHSHIATLVLTRYYFDRAMLLLLYGYILRELFYVLNDEPHKLMPSLGYLAKF